QLLPQPRRLLHAALRCGPHTTSPDQWLARRCPEVSPATPPPEPEWRPAGLGAPARHDECLALSILSWGSFATVASDEIVEGRTGFAPCTMSPMTLPKAQVYG